MMRSVSAITLTSSRLGLQKVHMYTYLHEWKAVIEQVLKALKNGEGPGMGLHVHSLNSRLSKWN